MLKPANSTIITAEEVIVMDSYCAKHHQDIHLPPRYSRPCMAICHVLLNMSSQVASCLLSTAEGDLHGHMLAPDIQEVVSMHSLVYD